jgi:hypothetical protein
MTTCPGPDFPTQTAHVTPDADWGPRTDPAPEPLQTEPDSYALSATLTRAGILARYLELAAPVKPDRVNVSVWIDDETGRPYVAVNFDNTDGGMLPLAIADLEGAAGELDLTLTDSAATWQEWTGELEGADVSLILYGPDPDEDRTRLQDTARYLRQLPSALAGDHRGAALLLAAAGLGAGTALAARRALHR